MTRASQHLPVLLALNLALYAPFVGGYWVTDDFVHVERLQRATLAAVFTTPDAFGFYRPLPQASLFLDLKLFGETPWVFRLNNLVLHLAVVSAAWLVATMLLGRGRAAFLATLAFVLTPKAHPVAVLWPSARAELLMALFSMVAVACWIRWDSSGDRRWLLGACAAYPLALVSKESAVLLPLLLLVAVSSSQRLTLRRLTAAGVMVASAVALVGIRWVVGASTFSAVDVHYNLATPFSRWVRNARNYVGRALPSPLTFLLLVALPSQIAGHRGAVRASAIAIGPLAILAVAWFLTFIMPVLPIAGRSELYLYLPVFGLCLFVGEVLTRMTHHASRRIVLTCVAVYVVAFGSYQASRSLSVYRDARFSALLVESIASHDLLRRHSGRVMLTPADATAEELLRGSVGGYLGNVLRRTMHRDNIDGSVAYSNLPGDVDKDSLRLQCAFTNGRITIGS